MIESVRLLILLGIFFMWWRMERRAQYWSNGWHVRETVLQENKDLVDVRLEYVWREKPIKTFWGDTTLHSKDVWIKGLPSDKKGKLEGLKKHPKGEKWKP